MRSAAAQGAPPGLRQAHGRMGHRRRARRRRRARGVRRAARATGSRMGFPKGSRSSSRRRGRGRRGGAGGARGRRAMARRRGPLRRPPARHLRAHRRPDRGHASRGRRRHHPHHRRARPDRLRAHRARRGRQRRADRGDQVPRGRAGRAARRSARSTSAPTSSRRACSSRRSTRWGSRTASSTSPASSRCWPQRGGIVATHATDDADIALGVNDRAGLMQAEALAQRRILERHARDGRDLPPARQHARRRRASTIGADTTIGPGVSLLGTTRDRRAAARSARTPRSPTPASATAPRSSHTSPSEAEIGDGAASGPFAYLRPGTVVARGAKVGTFVEVKNSEIGAGAKVPAPLLHRRRRRGRGGQPRRQHDHGELRRPRASTARRSERARRPAFTPRSWRPSTSAIGRTLGPVR